MEVSPELKNFISDNADLIENNEFDKLFDKAEGKLNVHDYEEFVKVIRLAGIDILPYIKKIPAYYFKDSSFKEVTIPSKIMGIGYRAFADCKNLRAVYLPDSLEVISSNAFSGCNSLKDVYYAGTKAQWRKVGVLGFNDALYESNIHCIDEDLTYTRISDTVYKLPD